MIELTDVAYIRSGVADLDKAVRFATEMVGLELVGPADTGPDSHAGQSAGQSAGKSAVQAPGVRSAQLRADSRHHCLALVEGGSASSPLLSP